MSLDIGTQPEVVQLFLMGTQLKVHEEAVRRRFSIFLWLPPACRAGEPAASSAGAAGRKRSADDTAQRGKQKLRFRAP